MDLISVIVPVYGVEMYLDKCVESIIGQKNVQIEVILVDDGSPDQCPEMCDAWAKCDPRIKVVHKKNGGLSDARNAGMKIAQGKYIAFVDSDDWIDLNLYSTLLDAIKKTESDIACCKVTKIWDVDNVNSSGINTGAYKLYNPEAAIFELITDGNVQQVVWNKLYKKELVESVLFEIGKYNEDEFWTYQILGKATQIAVVDFVGYYYVQRNSSIMGSTYSLKRLNAVEAKIYRQEYLTKHFPQLNFVGKINLLYTCLYHGQLVMKNIKEDDKRRSIMWLENVFKTYAFRNKETSKLNFKDRIWLNLGNRNFRFTCWLRNLLKIGY